jgi:hypothetical protein
VVEVRAAYGSKIGAQKYARRAGRPARNTKWKSSTLKGVATHIDPKPCAGRRDAGSEASVAVVRRLANRAAKDFKYQSADVVELDGRQYECAFYASARSALRGRRAWHAYTFLVREAEYLRIGSATKEPASGSPFRRTKDQASVGPSD